MTFDIFREKVFAEAKDKGFTDFELFYSAANGFSVRVFKGEIQEYKNSLTEGVGFRGTYNGKMGYAYSESLDPGIIDGLLENAKANAGIIESEDIEELYPGDPSYPIVDTYNPALDAVSAEEKIAAALNMDKAVTELDSRIKMADYCMFSSSETSTAIANSHGLNLMQKSNMASAYVIARAEQDGITKSAGEFWQGRDFSEFDYQKIAETAVAKAIGYLGAESVETGEYKIVFDNYTAANFFAVFTSVFIAERCQKGFSLLSKDRLGEVIAAPFVTIRDDGVTDLSLYSKPFDVEGVATQNKAVIENGVLTNLLYNTKSAKKDGVKSTGNASKPGFGGALGTSVTNFYLVPGEKSFDEILAEVGDGLIITGLQGLHSGANPISGDFSFSADGFVIENGKKGRPVEQITVAGNFYELLKNIAIIGNDLRFYQNFGLPSIAVNGLKVAGK